MFGNLLGDMEERQKAMRDRLATIEVSAEAGNGAVTVVANANREILNISFNKEAIDWDDQEQLEDLTTIAVNRALQLAAEKEALESQKLIQDMLPPGMGDLSNLFGQG